MVGDRCHEERSAGKGGHDVWVGAFTGMVKKGLTKKVTIKQRCAEKEVCGLCREECS